MSVRRRTWSNPDGTTGEAWVVDYFDQHRKRHTKAFKRRKDADAHHAQVAVEVRQGTHAAAHSSLSIARAGQLWLASGEAAGLERATLGSYRHYLEGHLVPLIGDLKLAQLNVPMARQFEDELRATCSPAMAQKVMSALGAILAEAQERGLIAQNVVRSLRSRRPRGKERQADRRRKGKLKIGVDIPSPDEIRALVAHLDGRWRPLLLTAIFAGLRASELRGLRWRDVDFKHGKLHVRQRADRYNTLGPPKSESGERTLPLAPLLTNTLREWRLACPKGDLDLVFPNGAGRIENLTNIIKRGWVPVQMAAGVITVEGKAKYTGLHCLRHFYASWCLNRRVDGGLELPLKLVQSRLGHASIQMTADRYGHLFPSGDDGTELATAERAFFGPVA